MLSQTPAGPSGGQVPCSGCNTMLDPLRAGHVAIYNSKFHFFCDYEICRARFIGQQPAVPTPAQEERRAEQLAREARRGEIVEAVTLPVAAAESTPPPSTVLPDRLAVDGRGDLIEPLATPEAAALVQPSQPRERLDVGLLLVALALVAGGLSMALELAASSRLVSIARVVLLAVGTLSILGRTVTQRADPAAPHRVVMVLGSGLATAVAIWALLAAGQAQIARASFLAGTILTVHGLTIWLVGGARRSLTAARRWVEAKIDMPGRRVAAEPAVLKPKELSYDIRPGDHVVVNAGEPAPVDFRVVEGEAEVLPWVLGALRTRRRRGDVVVAGSKVVQGQLRGACTWAGEDRAIARSLLSVARRPDVHAGLARFSRRFVERWSLVVAALAGVAAGLLTGWRPLELAMVVVSVYAAVSSLAIGSLAGLSIARGVFNALSRGAVYNNAAGWESCSRVTTAILCARGTLLRGEPELVDIESLGDQATPEEVLTLAAGALSIERDPGAIAIRRAAQTKGLAADPVRNPRSDEGRGVTAVASTGEALCVGSRELLLERHISVAAADQLVYELESAGRTVIMVARGGRVIGLLGLQDGLRSGARAAVQHLLDARIEPVLMSADTRETCEALGRSLDIDHLRPKVSGAARKETIDRIKDTGAVVAVLGHSPFDDDALAAADASVGIASAGMSPDELSCSLVCDEVRDAALSLVIAQRARVQAAQVLALVLGPVSLGVVAVATGLLPPEFAPLALLVGTIVAVVQVRSSDRELGMD